jgi:hypothetical protein
MKIGSGLMVIFEASNFLNRAIAKSSSEPGKQRLFFVRGVALTAYAKVLKRRANCFCLFLDQQPALCTTNDDAEDVEKMFDPAMAIRKHADWIIESAIGFRPNLYSHRYSSQL